MEYYRKLLTSENFEIMLGDPEFTKFRQFIPPFTALKGIPDKHEQVRLWFQYYDYLPKQGTQAWVRNRYGGDVDVEMREVLAAMGVHRMRPTIGGSEIGTLLGENPYSDKYSLIEDKVVGRSFDGNLFTRWGHIFEPIMDAYTCKRFNTELYETGAVPGMYHNGVPIFMYSPDGVGVVQAQYLQPLTDIPIQDSVVMFEFKCPFSRVPNGDVPPQYRSQPLSGMCAIDICDCAVFGDAMFRKCSVAQLSTSGIDTELHSGTRITDVFERGITGLASRVPCEYLDELSGSEFKHTVELGGFETIYTEFIDAESSITDFHRQCLLAGLWPIGYFAWKLIKVDYIWIAKDPEYLEARRDVITAFSDSLVVGIENKLTPLEVFDLTDTPKAWYDYIG